MTEIANALLQRAGFDAAVGRREDDKLGRWPFAQEVYRIAASGPSEWSVRIGIYGEWGTGKTSVLDMLESMARRDGHILVRFNPWAFTEKIDLWHAFVQAVVAAIPVSSLPVKKRWWQCIQKPAAPLAEWLAEHSEKISSVTEGKTVGAALVGLELVKGFLFSSKTDLEKILKQLGNKRLIILIDDLDRANGSVVPEILYAIKEIMDVGGLAFVCAFDPFVIGKILGDYHKGFADGLKFLEKIVDYPRWLPPPRSDGLARLARADAATYCPYVPEQALMDVIPLLPSNPRAIRQFIRLLALMKPQVDRHRPDELNWPIILAANVIKVRFPQLAHPLLEDEALWHDVYGINLMAKEDDEKKLRELISGHICKVATDHATELSEGERQQLSAAMTGLAKRLDAWTGVREESMLYQLHIAEAPSAVTWKEYDQFFDSMAMSMLADTANSWIKAHSLVVDRSYDDIFKKLFFATVSARQSALSRAADAPAESQMKPLLQQAEGLMTILEFLTFDLADLKQKNSRITPAEFKATMDSLMYYASFTNTPAYRDMRTREATYLKKFVQQWGGSVAPLVIAMEALSDPIRRDLEGKNAKALYKELADIAIPRFAEELLERFSEQGFIEHAMSHSEGTHEIRCVLLDANGTLWAGLRKEVLKVLTRAATVDAIHHNAYELLLWFDYKLRKEPGFQDTVSATNILKDAQIGTALWEAATARPLNPRAIGSLHEFPTRLKELGLEVVLPKWWTRGLEELGLAGKAEDTKDHK